MGDAPPSGAHTPDDRNQGPPEIAYSQDKTHSGNVQSPHYDPRAQAPYTPFSSQYGTIPQIQTNDPQRYGHPQSAAQYAPSPGGGGGAFNMTGMSGALPDYSGSSMGHHPQQQQQQPPRVLSGASTPAVVYQLQQNLQFPGAGANYASQAGPACGYGQPSYPTQYAQGAQSPYGAAFSPGGPRSGGGMQQSFSYGQQAQQYYYYPPAFPGQAQPGQAGQQFSPYDRRSNISPSQAMRSGFYGGGMQGGAVPGVGMFGGQGGAEVMHVLHRQSSESSLSSVPRGPPRKPKQSGHALWVGNLPPGTTVVDLKDHFSRDATKDIESLFLISKSNCAFVNYRTEAACTAAMHRFHDSKFHGVRLVCRLRRSSAPASGVPTGPSAMTGQPPQTAAAGRPVVDGVGEQESKEEDVQDGEQPASQPVDSGEKAQEKFFIVKSLTLQDLELSVRTGVWATQAHNEEGLNKAFESAENVYLIFSANKSGEYFGYARMTSPINDESIDLKTLAKPNANTSSNRPAETALPEAADAPKSIPTPATEFAPKGRIIDDSARGTIFWEADLDDGSDVEEGDVADKEKADGVTPDSQDEVDGESVAGTPTIPAAAQDPSWGKPFRIEWICTTRLPFYRTRGLRNQWNANREVKIARDGTELETSVGRRLVGMFQRQGGGVGGGAGQSQQQQQQQAMMGGGAGTGAGMPGMMGGGVGGGMGMMGGQGMGRPY
ncbi:hypothetical protein K402DRAFT_415010 [Aulographum hederae CBS 113979]|uniref:YTH domain-containing protein n=1 Tax=Aulographum hederae CBS 113979 TaxID=1176131 RepID=A0A6G1GNJ0_9PEZI|nr:hypothetical protein K402DRAFT_415010 [Aulographum hederae CBS 113979]